MNLQPERFAQPRFALPSRRSMIGAAVLALCAGHAAAVAPFVVKDIRVEGIQRTEAGTVFSYLPVRVGETFDDDKGTAAIKALYATGFFKDIRLEEESGVLVVLVEERPAIASVDFTGTKEFEKDMLVKALKEIGVGETKIFEVHKDVRLPFLDRAGAAGISLADGESGARPRARDVRRRLPPQPVRGFVQSRRIRHSPAAGMDRFAGEPEAH